MNSRVSGQRLYTLQSIKACATVVLCLNLSYTTVHPLYICQLHCYNDKSKHYHTFTAIRTGFSIATRSLLLGQELALSHVHLY